MSSPHPAFRLYYRLVGALQRHYGQELAIGRALDGALVGSGWNVEIGEVRELSLPARGMARLHGLNLGDLAARPVRARDVRAAGARRAGRRAGRDRVGAPSAAYAPDAHRRTPLDEPAGADGSKPGV